MEVGKKWASKYGVYIVAKDKYTVLFCPSGKTVFNGSGGSWLSTGGSGDKLTGAIAAWWARTGNPEIASIIGSYLSGIRELA